MTADSPVLCHSQSWTNQLFQTGFLTIASWPKYRFLRRQVRWSGIPNSKSFPVCYDPHKGFSIVDETEVDVFLEFPCFLYDPVNVGNLISGSFSFSAPSLDIWKFLVHVMLKPSMQNFKHDLTSMGDECNCLMISTFFNVLPNYYLLFVSSHQNVNSMKVEFVILYLIYP